MNLTNHPSRAGWDRDAETAALVAWNGAETLPNRMESARLDPARREWVNFGLEMPDEPQRVPAWRNKRAA